MNVVQIARLVKDEEGVGLLPFVLGGLFVSLAGLRDRGRGLCYILLSYWTLSIVFTALDLARLSKLNVLNPAKGSQYPSSDKVVDNAVLLGLYAILAFIELWAFVKMKRPAVAGSKDLLQ